VDIPIGTEINLALYVIVVTVKFSLDILILLGFIHTQLLLPIVHCYIMQVYSTLLIYVDTSKFKSNVIRNTTMGRLYL